MKRKIKLFSFLVSFGFAVSLSPVLAQTTTTPDSTAAASPASDSPTASPKKAKATKKARKARKAKKIEEAKAAPAAPATPTVTLGGMVDTYLTYNFTNAAATQLGAGNNGTYFNHADNSYSLGLAEISLTATQGSGSGHLVLAYGQEGSLGLAAWGVNGIDVLQAYVAYGLDKWTFSLGRMATHMGNEVIESKSNWNYSRSLLFWYTIPLWHDGLSVAFAPDSQFGVTAYIYNGWNNAFATSNSMEKTFGLQASIKPTGSALNFVLNGIYGPNPSNSTDGNPRFVLEEITNWAVTSEFSVAMDFEYGSQGLGAGSTPGFATFWGLDLYGRYQLQDGWALALRLEEVMDDEDMLGLYGALPMEPAKDVECREATFTIEKALTPNTLLRVEARYDGALSGGNGYSSTPVNMAPVGPFAGGNSAQFTTTGSLVFSF